jgi:hypothetical protein
MILIATNHHCLNVGYHSRDLVCGVAKPLLGSAVRERWAHPPGTRGVHPPGSIAAPPPAGSIMRGRRANRRLEPDTREDEPVAARSAAYPTTPRYHSQTPSPVMRVARKRRPRCRPHRWPLRVVPETTSGSGAVEGGGSGG